MKVVDRYLKPGAIVLMHNGNEISVKALPEVIELIRSRGYRFICLSEVLGSPLE